MLHRFRPLHRSSIAILAAATLATAACSSPVANPAALSSAAVSTSSPAPSSTAAGSTAPTSAGAAGSSASAPTTGSAEAGDPAYVAALQPQLDQIMKDLSITGAVVLIRSPELGDWATAMGTRTWHGNDPVSLDDHIRIGSNTKPMTGTVILQLVDEGKISLDDPVSKYRPEAPNGDNITIAQLLNMSSGLGNYTVDPVLNEQQDNNPSRAWTPDDLLAMGFAEPVKFSPGEGYFYSNTNYVLLGVIIEQLTGMTVEEAFQERIFDRLGMSQNSFPANTDSSVPEPHPTFYTWGTNVGTIDSSVMSPQVQAAALDGTLEPIDTTDLNPSWAWTAGSAISTADDLAVFAEALAGGGLLSPELQAQRMTDLNPTKPEAPNDTDYGLAIARIGPMYGHTGELPGTNSYMFYDPDRKITLITWASTAPAPNGEPPAVVLADAAKGVLYGTG